MKLIWCALTVALAGAVQAAPLEVAYGPNRVDINADGVPDLIVRTRWDVVSAHSADMYLIAVAHQPDGYDVVGTETDNTTMLATSEGADCVLSGYVFRLNSKKMLEVDYYKREMGESYSDSRPVTVTTYQLANREQVDLGGIGLTPYYLKKVHERVTKERYCDVRELMK